jgi:hypothetical protein
VVEQGLVRVGDDHEPIGEIGDVRIHLEVPLDVLRDPRASKNILHCETAALEGPEVPTAVIAVLHLPAVGKRRRLRIIF